MTLSSSNKNRDYIDTLTRFGLKPQEAEVYLACLQLGQAVVSKIAETAGVQRTFVYDIVKNLVKEDLLSEVEIKGKLHYSAISIDKFKKLQEEKMRHFEKLMPEIKALEKMVGDRPKVQFFEGAEGIKLALEDTLNQPQNGEILAFATAEGYYSQGDEFIHSYLKRRVKKGIKMRAIGPGTKTNKEWVARDKEQLRETRLVDAELYPFTNEIDIYGNKVAIMSLVGELLAVIIESESVAKTQRAIFELAWKGAYNDANSTKKRPNDTN